MDKSKLILKKTHDYSAVKRPKLIVVMIHGIASDSSTFGRVLRYLENIKSLNDVRFVTFDLLGSGESLKNDDLDYSYSEQIESLHNSINELSVGDTPLVLIGHSMGTLIVTRYAETYKNSVNHLILISPPIYTEKDLDNPAFAAGMKVFQDAVSVRNREVVEEKSFKNSISKIVMNRRNYTVLSNIKVPTVLIFGAQDRFIGIYNIPHLTKENPNITAIRTEGLHGVSRDKYTKLTGILEGILHA